MRSANEISGMVLKAARGAGMPLGCAEDLARVAPALAKNAALSVAVELLERPFDMPIYQDGAVNAGHPVLAILSWLDLCAAGETVRLETDVPKALLDAFQSEDSPSGPFEVEESVWAKLQTNAERTFVPETEASRLAGAGAGLTDND